jgi:hypothetical protein
MHRAAGQGGAFGAARLEEGQGYDIIETIEPASRCDRGKSLQVEVRGHRSPVETNLLSHRIATLIQDLALPEFQGEAGFSRIVTLVDEGLQKVGSNVRQAALSDFRKLYHEDWKAVLAAVCPESYREVLDDRFRQLVF